MDSDNRRVGAKHEIAHALAYIAHGLHFSFVELDEVGGGQVHVNPRRIRKDWLACVAMAGPAADFYHRLICFAEDEVIREYVEGWAAISDLIDLPDASEMRSDEATALGTGHMRFAFGWGGGFYQSNHDLIGEIAQELLDSDGRLEYDTVYGLAHGRINPPDEPTQMRLLLKLQPYAAQIEDLQDHIHDVLTLPAPSWAD